MSRKREIQHEEEEDGDDPLLLSRTDARRNSNNNTQKRGRPSQQHTGEETLSHVLSECGVQFRKDHVVVADVASFRTHATACLEQCDSVRHAFLVQLQDQLGREDTIRRLLLPTRSPRVDSMSGTQESLMKLLLSIRIIQSQVAEMLLCYLPTYATWDGSDPPFVENIPRLIISQFRWMQFVVDSNDLSSKLLQFMDVVPDHLKPDIVSLLPEIVDGAEHREIVNDLTQRIRDGHALMVPVLDALTNMNLRPDVISDVIEMICPLFRSARLEDLPALVRFVLQSVSPAMAPKVIQALRKDMEFQQSTHEKSSEALVLDAIRTGLRYQKFLVPAFLKEIQNASQAEQRPFDLWVLFIIASMTTHTKAAIAAFRKGISANTITMPLLCAALENHTESLREYHGVFLMLADVFLRSPDATIRSFGCSFYRVLFRVFLDPYSRQEVLAGVVTHAASGIASELDATLDILLTLVKEDADGMRCFATFVRGLLDFMDSFDDPQVRKMYELFCTLDIRLDRSASLNESSIHDDVHIVIRKQLSNPLMKYKKMGIIGATMVLRRLGTRTPTPLTPDRRANARSMLDVVTANLNDEISRAFFYDELASLVEEDIMDPVIVEELLARINDDFDTEYFVEYNPDHDEFPPFHPHLQSRCRFNLDQRDAAIALKLFPQLASMDKQERAKPLLLAPMFRLVQACARARGDTILDEISAVLGCPIIVFSEVHMEEFDRLDGTEKDLICQCLFHTANWFRAVISAWAEEQATTEIRGKVQQRLEQLIQVEAELRDCMEANPRWIPPLSSYGPDTGDRITPVVAKKGKEYANAERRGRRSTEKGGKGKEPALTRSVPLQAYQRELELRACTILGYCTPITLVLRDSIARTETADVINLKPQSIIFLLECLKEKVDRHVPSTRRAFPPKSTGQTSNESVELFLKKLIPLAPSLRWHMDKAIQRIHGEFEERGRDSLEEPLETLKDMNTILHLVFRIVERIFQWPNLKLADHGTMRRNLLISLLMDPEGSMSSQSFQCDGDGDAENRFFRHIEDYATYVHDLPLAVVHLDLLAALSAGSQEEIALHHELSAVAKGYLQKKWGDPKSLKPEHVAHIVALHIRTNANRVKVLEDLCHEKLADAMGQAGVADYPVLCQTTFDGLFKVLMKEVVNAYCEIDFSGEKHLTEAVVGRCLREGTISTACFEALMKCTEHHQSHKVIGTCLKHGKSLVVEVMKSLPSLSKHIKGPNREPVLRLISSLQQSTRIMQRICNHGKVQKNVALVAQVPGVKRVMESFIYKVQNMCEKNNILGAFRIGVLKQRTLDGRTVSSQPPNPTEEDSSNNNDDTNDKEEERVSEQSSSDSEDESGVN